MSTSNAIRQQFIDFFIDKCGHSFVPSSPVVPHDDPTLLFTNAGMNQFKDVFLGVGERPCSRAVNSQKCIRAGGKHNDLDDVGKDTYHHTFFEMLGNWSFGDYFKTEAIDWAWQLLTEIWGLDQTRLYATYFEGNASEGLEPDHEARDLWLKYLPPERVLPGDMKDNFWEMGETGPCGPCSEIHIDLTDDKTGGKLVNQDDPRAIEIWNLVFIQFNRSASGELSNLPSHHVDTGMGFERICAVIQGKNSNYDTDVFAPLFEAIREISGVRAYAGKMDDPIDTAYRVIADHARCLTFAIADGAMPSNDGRGYVLRRILRRAVRYGRQNLEIDDLFLYRLVRVVVDQMGDVFPELKDDPEHIATVVREEEESFGRTLDRGIELFERAAITAADELIERSSFADLQPVLEANGIRHDVSRPEHFRSARIDWTLAPKNLRPRISGEDAFRLYDTYGFPLDLTMLMAEERGLQVDERGFDDQMEKARKRSRADSGTGDGARQSLLELVQKEQLPATRFLGYKTPVNDDGTPLRILAKTDDHYEPIDTLEVGQAGAVVVSRTPFYAEAGGQVGDRGYMHTRHGAVFRVDDTIRIGGVFFHLGELEAGSVHRSDRPFSMDDQLLLEVDQPRRRAIAIHHTVTHLLNWALREVLGDHVQQKGSLVDDTRTRFDFSHPKPLSAEQVEKIEKLVNKAIEERLVVFAAVAPQEEARKIRGLRAVFGEKYPEKVRVVSIGVSVDDLLAAPTRDWTDYSIEFCGGIHLKHTGEAQRFVITNEEAVAKGIRRVTGIAGPMAGRALAHGQVLTERIAALKEAHPDSMEQDLQSLNEALTVVTMPHTVRMKLRQDLTDLQKQAKAHRRQSALAAEGQVVDTARQLADQASNGVIVASIDGADANSLRTAMDVIRKKKPDAAMLLAAAGEDKIAFLAAVPQHMIEQGLKAGDWVREVAKVAGGGGGGRPDMAQAGGKDPAKLDEALDTARRFVMQKISA
ncbi:MAG: alanine--tRNA ligase [Phycisphaeraceae bacterium]